MDRIRVGMIGYGVGKLLATALRSVGFYYRGFPPVDLVAVATATQASGENAQEHFGFEWHSTDYRRLLEHLEIGVEEFLMVGNSLKSDVLPILNIGARAIHIPFHTTWAHEVVEPHQHNNEHLTLPSLRELLRHLT